MFNGSIASSMDYAALRDIIAAQPVWSALVAVGLVTLLCSAGSLFVSWAVLRCVWRLAIRLGVVVEVSRDV